MSLHGHWWTLKPHFARRLAVRSPVNCQDFFHAISDPVIGPVRLSGRISTNRSRTVVLLVHGLGGSSESPYVVRLAHVAEERGWATLRLNLRGADLRGDDYYHAGLSSDLVSVLGSPSLRDYEEVFVVGFSLGGHVCLKLAALDSDPRLRAIATISAPMDLGESARYFDENASIIYRRHVLSSLANMLGYVAARRNTPVTPAQARAIRWIREWDDRVVAPRHGFASAQDYYDQVNAARTMSDIRVPTLVVHAKPDPMVSLAAVEPALMRASASVVAFLRPEGGHLGFPDSLDLGQPGPLGLEAQVVSWLKSHSASAPANT